VNLGDGGYADGTIAAADVPCRLACCDAAMPASVQNRWRSTTSGAPTEIERPVATGYDAGLTARGSGPPAIRPSWSATWPPAGLPLFGRLTSRVRAMPPEKSTEVVRGLCPQEVIVWTTEVLAKVLLLRPGNHWREPP
jgi:hypothetical protein